MPLLNVAGWVECTEAEGPGRRFALWVQGCLLQCPGCCNPQMFDFSPRTIIEADNVFQHVLRAKAVHGIEGVTLLGGEPMLQAQGLSRLAFLCRENDVSVMVFTGYNLDDLRGGQLPGVTELVAYTDILVDGPYIRELPDRERRWTGSRNQRFRYLTDRYPTGLEAAATHRDCEIAIRPDGTLRMNGWPAVSARTTA
jgi:anaerobic ribonucleoside-triphosphate reductase activating protein